MTIEKMFETATRNRMRFPYKGMISVEDLWELSPEQLDTIFKALNTQLKQVSEESLLQTKTAADKELEVKIEIVKYIVQVKLNEAKARLEAKENKEKREKLMTALAKKQDAAIENMSEEDLQAAIAALDK